MNNEYNFDTNSHGSKSTKMSNFLKDAKRAGPERNS